MPILYSNILGTGTPLFILHGYFGMSDNWKSIANHLSKNYEVHLIDQRNHGRSFHSDDFNYDLMSKDLKRYMQYHQIDKAILLGHSMGGKTAMQFATDHPEKTTALIVADIAPKYYPPHHQQILDGLQAVDFSVISLRSEVEKVLTPFIAEKGIRQFLMKNIFRKPPENKLAFRFNLKTLIEKNNEIGSALEGEKKYNGRVLFLRGTTSNYIKPSDEKIIKKYFPTAEIKAIENAGHWLHAENPTDFLTAVNTFFNKMETI